jgi:predicted  nucleic acid-binding Zn-ribbon protein
MRAVQCNRCGEMWPDGDPALRVACPSCQAPPGRVCRRPSAHECVVHAARDRLAMEQGLLRPCPALTIAQRSAGGKDGGAVPDDRHAKPLPFPARQASPLACAATAPSAGPAQGVPL